jgi:hypothetical protein
MPCNQLEPPKQRRKEEIATDEIQRGQAATTDATRHQPRINTDKIQEERLTGDGVVPWLGFGIAVGREALLGAVVVMGPTFETIADQAVAPYLDGKLSGTVDGAATVVGGVFVVAPFLADVSTWIGATEDSALPLPLGSALSTHSPRSLAEPRLRALACKAPKRAPLRG